jgi:hypothetical protein
MEKIPTAEEFLELQHETVPSIEFDIRQVMIQFAKLHVEAALKARDELYQTYYAEEINWTEDNIKFIKNSYPLENIK